MQQVHKVIQRKVPCAMEGRDDVNSVVQGMYGIPFDIIEEYQAKHQKKIGDIDSKRQQRISWAVVSAAPTPEQFLAQLAVGNVYFPGFTTAPETYMSAPRYSSVPAQATLYNHEGPNMYQQGAPMNFGAGYMNPSNAPGAHGYQAPALGREEKRGHRFTNGYGTSGFQSQDDLAKTKGFGPSGSGPLILGPKGVPIESSPGAANFSSTQTAVRPSGISANGVLTGSMGITQTPRGFSNAPGLLPKTAGFSDAPGFSKPAGFSDPHGVTAPKGFSDAPGEFSDAPYREKSFSDKGERLGTSLNEQEKMVEASSARKSKPPQTQFYRSIGVAPLYTPPPTLANTKLAYDIDAVSIEERRAKLLYKWEDTL